MRRRVHGLLFAAGVGLAGALFVATPLGLSFEERIGLSWLFYVRGPVAPPREAAVVAIDERSAIDLGLAKAPREWPRSLHGQLIDALVERGADVIVFDLAFVRPQPAEADAAFAAAIARSGRVLLFESIERQVKPLGPEGGRDVVAETFTEPLPELSAAAMGIAPLPLPNVPTRISRFWTFLGQSEDRVTLPALALMAYGLHYDRGWPGLSPGWVDPLQPADGAARQAAGVTRIDVLARALRRQVKFGVPLEGLPPPADEKTRQLRHALLSLYGAPDAHYLNFYGPPGTIRHIGYAQLLACRWRTDPPCDIDLSGTVVFVGFSELSKPPDFSRDAFPTVYARPDGVYLSGVEIAATAFANLLTVSTLQPPPLALALPLVLLLGIAFGLAAALLPPQTAVPSTLALGLAYAIAAQLLFAHPGLWLPISTPILAQLPMALIGGIGGQLLLARRQEQELRRAKATADAASEAKTQTLRMAGHDIRTPVQAMVGYLEQFRATSLDVDQQALLDRLLAASDTLLGMLNAVLDLSAIEAGKLRIVDEPVELRRLASAFIDMFQPQAAAKGLTLSLTIAPDVPAVVRTDPLRLRQVLGNLLANAIKFTDRGQVALHADMEPGTGTPVLVFSVIDTGIGIGAEALAELFEPFSRGGADATRRPGSGLGLSISQRLAALMGGRISVESQPGIGSTFRLHLPAAPVIDPAWSPPLHQPVPSWGLADIARAAPPLRPFEAAPAVLIVEDDPAICGLLEQQIGDMGLTVLSAGDGSAAWERLQQAPVRALITDFRMPGLDGPTLIRRARADDRFTGMPIIGLTADTAADVAESFRAAGADAVLLKPVTGAELQRALHRLGALSPEPTPERKSLTPELLATLALGESPVVAAADTLVELESWPVFDPANIVDALGHDPERLGLVTDVYWRQTDELIAAIGDAAAGRDAVTVARIAHRVAGSSLSFGAIRLGETSRTLERLAGAEDWAGIDPLVGGLRDIFSAAAAACRLAVAAITTTARG